tara:strand:+ start:3700 stop:4449 length:750 start_codon:yes stop_codon:yes gene_type:complete
MNSIQMEDEITNYYCDYIFNVKYFDTNYLYIKELLLNYLKDKYKKILLIGNNIEYIINYINKNYNDCYLTCVDLNLSICNKIKSNKIEYINSLNNFINHYKNYENEYDLIITHNSLINLDDKEILISLYYKILNVEGCLTMIEYCSGQSVNLQENFLKYCKKKNYKLNSIFSIAGMLDKNNFFKIKTKDNISILIKNIEEDLENLNNNKKYYLSKFNELMYEKQKILWNDKLEWFENKNLGWGFIFCYK